MAKVNQTLVKNAIHDESKDVFYWDDEIKGFGLKVAMSGVKCFVFQYRNQYGKSRRITIDKTQYKKATDARNEAKSLRHQVEAGIDPLEEKRAKAEAETVGEMLNDYIASARFAENTETTQKYNISRIEHHLKPLLGKRYLDELTKEHVRRAFASIRDGKTAKTIKTGPRGLARVKGGPGAARMCIRLLRVALNWAIEEGKISTNPASGIQIGQDKSREAIINPDQYKEIFETITRMEEERRLQSHIADAIRVIALTGARRSEIAQLTWDSVKDGKLVIQNHKTQKKTNKPRLIALPSAAQAIIARQPKTSDLVFGPDGMVSDLSQQWRRIRDEAEIPKEITLHTMRHSLASGMAMQGFSSSEIMTALGHSQISTSQKYIHWAEQEQAKLADRASASIVAAMEGKEKADIVPIRSKQNG